MRLDALRPGDQMTSRKEDCQRLVFERILDKGPRHVDLFGRPVQEKPVTAPTDGAAKTAPRKDKD